MESLWEYIPQECLPKDYGGAQKPLDELYGKNSKTSNASFEI